MNANFNQNTVPEIIIDGINQYKETVGSKDLSDTFEITKDDNCNMIIQFPYDSFYLSDVIHHFKELRLNPDNDYDLYKAQCVISFLKNLSKFDGQSKAEIMDNLNKNYVGERYVLEATVEEFEGEPER